MLKYAIPLVVLFAGCDKDEEGDGVDGTPLDLDVVSDISPDKRSEILAATHAGSNAIMIFGGNYGPVVAQIPSPLYRNDTWIFEPGAGWSEVISDETPRKRGRYAIAVDEQNNRALMFGGRFRAEGESGDYTLFDDLWEFDFDSRQWTKLSSSGTPDARYYASALWVAEEEAMYLWGGLVNENPLAFETSDDLFVWDGSSWTELETSGDAPSARGFLGVAHDTKRNELVMFGGQVGDLSSLAYNDTYALSLDDLTWRELHDGAGKAPSTRMHAHLTYDEVGDRYILFGGHTDEGDMNDLWVMDPETNKWDKLYIADKFTGERFGCMDNASEVPADYVSMDLSAPERRHRGMYTILHDNLWVFGGIHAECGDHLDDTWRFDLATGTWTELIEANTGESCLRAGNDCECLCL